MDLDQACPKCKTTKYRNPKLKLMVNVCGHALCENCVDLLFLKGAGACPDCGVALRRSNFRVQLFEDPKVEKEVEIRKRVLRDYNKKLEDFPTPREYDDYLEEIETIVYNLTNNIDIVQTNKRIEQYKRENRENILKNKSKIGREEYELEELIELEKHHDELRKKQLHIEEQEIKKKKIREKEALIDELMFSEENAKNIVETFSLNAAVEEEMAKTVKPVATQFSTGIKIQNRSGFLPIPKIEEGPLFNYVPKHFETNGPPPPTNSELFKVGYIKHVRSETTPEKAGGWLSNIACQRILEDALAGLYFVPTFD